MLALKTFKYEPQKNVDQGSWQGAVRRKSAAYTLVCEHFEPSRKIAMIL